MNEPEDLTDVTDVTDATMHAAVLHTAGQPPRYDEHPAPAAATGSTLVRVTAAPLVPLDLLCASGTSYFGVPATPYVPGGKLGFLAITAVTFVILGSVLEGIPAIVLFGPLLFPVAKAMGVHEVHYAMVIILAMGIGLFAPPFGVGFYGACAIGRVSPDEALWRI